MSFVFLIFSTIKSIRKFDNQPQFSNQDLKFDSQRQNNNFTKLTSSFSFNENSISSANDVCSAIQLEDHADCYPEPGASEDACRSRGCCWIPNATWKLFKYKNAPECFYPKGYPSYSWQNITRTPSGFSFIGIREKPSYRPNDIMQVRGDVSIYDGGIIHIKVRIFLLKIESMTILKRIYL